MRRSGEKSRGRAIGAGPEFEGFGREVLKLNANEVGVAAISGVGLVNPQAFTTFSIRAAAAAGSVTSQ